MQKDADALTPQSREWWARERVRQGLEILALGEPPLRPDYGGVKNEHEARWVAAGGTLETYRALSNPDLSETDGERILLSLKTQ